MECALEVVDDREQILDRLASRVVGEIAPFAVHALTVIVEFRSRTEQSILQRVTLSANLFERVRLGLFLPLLRVLIVQSFGHDSLKVRRGGRGKPPASSRQRARSHGSSACA